MKKYSVLLALLAIVTVSASLYAADGEHTVVLEDPVGDTMEGAGLDIVRLTIESTGSSLDVTMDVAGDAREFLKENMAGAVAELHLDTDNDASTGGITFWGDEGGFEYVVTIRACIEYESGHACAGALGGMPIAGYYTSFGVERYEQAVKETNDTHDDPFWKSPRGTVEGSIVKASIPYSELGLASGSRVRVLARESGGPFEEAYLPITAITLK